MAEDKPFRLKWRRTWPGEMKNDFAARDSEVTAGRFYRIDQGPQKGHWQWAVTAFHTRPTAETGPHHGIVKGTARGAARMVEETYFRWLAAGVKPWVRDPRWTKLPDPWD